MDDNKQNRIYEVLGELRADMRHLLAASIKNGQAVEELRESMQAENEKLNSRLQKVERFNTRFAAYATVAGMVMVPLISYLVPIVVSAL